MCIILTPTLAQVDTLSPKSNLRYGAQKINESADQPLRSAEFRKEIKDVTDLVVGRIPSMTISDFRAGRADTAKVIQISDNDKSGIFKYTPNDLTSLDDSTMVLVIGKKRYLRQIESYYNTRWITSSLEKNFFKMINMAGSTSQTFILNKTIPITSNRSIPENIKIDFQSGATFNVSSGYTLNILSAVNEGGQQLFTGDGIVKLNAPTINIKWFGAIGNSDGMPGNGAENSSAINRAIDAARLTGAKILIPDGNFRVSKSINLTKVNPNDSPLILEGISKTRSIITLDLNEEYPGIDCSNNKRGSLNNVCIKTTKSSLDLCSVLFAENSATGVNLFVVNNSIIQNQSAKAKASVVGICADQLRFLNSEVQATGANCSTAFFLSGNNKYDVKSKFVKIGTFTGDLTSFSSIASQFTCSGNNVVELEMFALVAFTDAYFSALNTNFKGALISLKSGGRNMQPIFNNIRTEGGQSAGSADVFKIVDYVENGIFVGTFNARRSGGLFTGPGTMRACVFKGSSTVPIFREAGPLISCDFTALAGSNILGTFASGAVDGSINLQLTGRVGEMSEVISTLGTVKGLKLKQIGTGTNVSLTSSTEGIIFPSTNTPLNYRIAYVGESGSLTKKPYTGGSGLKEISSFILPIATLVPTGIQKIKVQPYLEFEIWGDMPASYASNGTLEISLKQGSTTTVVGSLVNIPAGEKGFRVICKIYTLDEVGTLASMMDISSSPVTSGESYSSSKYSNLDSSGLNKKGGNITVSIQVSNAASNPITHLFHSIGG